MSYKKYSGAAGGWGALASTAKHLLKSENVAKNIKNLLNTNQDKGFDCPGCAWGEKDEPGRVRFCENGAKAVNWEATSKRIDANFFQAHSVRWLKKQSDYFLEDQGRLAEPLLYDQDSDHYQSVSWQQAFDLIGEQLNKLDRPDQAEFYTSGRASNEAAFLYQLFVRRFGTNNFPDCSNMCHEASGYALKESIGVGKGTVTLADFEQADAIFVFGQNPGTNHPRMLDTLSHATRRGAKVVTFNPLKERGLERFSNPQSVGDMLTGSATEVSSLYFTPNLGGDMALVRGMVKALLAQHQLAIAQQQQGIFDLEFIEQHTAGLDEYLAEVENTAWSKIIVQSGLSEQEIKHAANVYQQADKVILTWAMGITQHKHSVATIQEMTNLQLLFGQIGKAGAGLCPVRGHSNVQGDRTMGINEKPPQAFLDQLEKVFDFTPPQQPGHNVVQAIEAMLNGESKAFIALGGNFAAATPDTQLTQQALSNCKLTVNIATKLNRTHLYPGEVSLLLPCLGRTDIDLQAGEPQKVTVEDSFSMVHASQGVVESDVKDMRSEPAIIAGIAQAMFGNEPIAWLDVCNNYDKIRDLIAAVLPEFSGFNAKINHAGGFYLGNSAAQLTWLNASGRAEIKTHSLPDDIVNQSQRELTNNKIFVLQTLRSHDQYNTTVYGFEDRYRGISGERCVLLMNETDIESLAMSAGQKVDIVALWPDDIERKVTNFTLIPYDIPCGNVASYFPEANPLVALASYGDHSFTPTSKSIAVVVTETADTAKRIL
ncbi:FdhF/YdeP family oxidoreductase [Thalassotalea atypica]|uniref:FdhF/YdeP family oxidoreductase n=1 Tax=Thalassotalea atypica TaxID=2054316 RepID=UPI0025724E02|nr:FdhF/YdeP family oxidoreductase [Thalassotalea atypica]